MYLIKYGLRTSLHGKYEVISDIRRQPCWQLSLKCRKFLLFNNLKYSSTLFQQLSSINLNYGMEKFFRVQINVESETRRCATDCLVLRLLVVCFHQLAIDLVSKFRMFATNGHYVSGTFERRVALLKRIVAHILHNFWKRIQMWHNQMYDKSGENSSERWARIRQLYIIKWKKQSEPSSDQHHISLKENTLDVVIHPVQVLRQAHSIATCNGSQDNGSWNVNSLTSPLHTCGYFYYQWC